MASSTVSTIKVVIVGECGVGKTSLLVRFTDNEFSEAHVFSSLGADIKSRTLSIGGQSITLQLWDTAGSERFRNVTTSYWHGAQVALLCYDISDDASFKAINSWKDELVKYGPTSVVPVVCGCKSDLSGQREVSADQGAELAKKFQALFFETSSKSGTGIDKLFEQAAQASINNGSAKDTPPEPTFGDVKVITSSSSSSSKKPPSGKKCTV